MARYLDFEKEEKGFEQIFLNAETIKANIGKRICYVNKRDIDQYRGYYNVRYGTIHSKRYSTLFLDDGNRDVDIRDIVECGIERVGN